jgi:DNA invertase Pin-like site-specific DNA recombinase
MIETNKSKGRIYGRFSSTPQEKGSSKQRQITETKRWAELNSIEIVDEPYFDEAVSGKNGANLSKELGRIIKNSKNGDYILCEEIDRLGRQNPIEICEIVYTIVKNGISIVATRTNQVLNKDTINDISTLLPLFTGATVGYVENTRKIDRLRKTNSIAIENALKGKHSPTLVKYLPNGFEWNSQSKLVSVNEEDAKIIKNIFRMYNDGMGVTSICYELNKSNTPTFNKRKKDSKSIVKPWMETTVRKILRNKSYCGELELNGHLITCIPRIIEKNIFDQTQYLIEKNKGRRGKNTGRTNNLFRNIGKCKYCKGVINVNISPQSKGRKIELYSYRCKNARLKSCEQPHKMLNANLVEPLFFDTYFNGNPEAFFTDDENKLEKQKEIIQQKIIKNQDAISNLLDLAETGNKQIKERLLKKQDEINDLEIELKTINEQIVNRPQSLSLYNYFSDEIDPTDEIVSENKDILTNEEKLKVKNFINNYHAKLIDKLSDYDLRKKISYTMQSLFSEIVFDCTNKTIQGIKTNGDTLPIIEISRKNKLFSKF